MKDSFALIIFGITSNLAQIKLVPALYDMAEKNLLPENMSIVGIARKPQTQDEFKKYFHYVLHLENKHHLHDIKDEVFKRLENKLHYLDGNLDDKSFYKKLQNYLDDLTVKGHACHNRIYYLATYPELYHNVFENLSKLGMNTQNNGWVRLMIEKPIGTDLKSAQQLNSLLTQYFSEDQIYRLDHYLGKETLQNILTFRFSNGIFEPLMNKDFIDHIQISALEDFGIGARGGYYDKVGALKDVGQNHLLQMLAFATMDAPLEFSNEAVTKERVKILSNLKPVPKSLVLGQYDGYQKEDNVLPESQADTFFAFKTQLANRRFAGVPIYIRGGKKLKSTVTEISIIFKTPINRLFKHLDRGDKPNVLIYRIQPNEGIVLEFVAKKPGHTLELEPSFMQFCYQNISGSHYLPDPYERLLSDAIRGDQTFFNDSSEIEAQWSFVDRVLGRSQQGSLKPHLYKSGSWGPKEADSLIAKDGRKWLEPSLQFCTF